MWKTAILWSKKNSIVIFSREYDDGKNHNDNSIMHIIHIYTYIYIHSENHKTVDEEDDLELNFFWMCFRVWTSSAFKEYNTNMSNSQMYPFNLYLRNYEEDINVFLPYVKMN